MVNPWITGQTKNFLLYWDLRGKRRSKCTNQGKITLLLHFYWHPSSMWLLLLFCSFSVCAWAYLCIQFSYCCYSRSCRTWMCVKYRITLEIPLFFPQNMSSLVFDIIITYYTTNLTMFFPFISAFFSYIFLSNVYLNNTNFSYLLAVRDKERRWYP